MTSVLRRFCPCLKCRSARWAMLADGEDIRRETNENAEAAVSAEAKRYTHMAKTADKCKQPAKPVQVCAMTTGQAIKWLQTLPPRAKMAGTCGDQGLCMKYDCGTKTVSVAECLS